MIDKLPINQRYTHYKKGGLYVILCYAIRESDFVSMVVYKSVETLKVWVRPESEFLEKFLSV